MQCSVLDLHTSVLNLKENFGFITLENSSHCLQVGPALWTYLYSQAVLTQTNL